MRALVLAMMMSVLAFPVWANARVTLLMEALRVSEVISILYDEGILYSQTLNDDMLNGQGGALWDAQVRQIYDVQRIEEVVRQGLETTLTDSDVDAALTFFSDERGARIIEMENAARRAMIDPEVEDYARSIYEGVRGEDTPLKRLVARYITANGLLERNVTGAMGANYQFYKGLSDGRFMNVRRSNEDIISEVWSQEEDIRTDTESWLYGFLMMAYEPLPLEDLEVYVAFSESAEGKALNAGLFEGFEVVYRDVSYALGRAVALAAAGDEI